MGIARIGPKSVCQLCRPQSSSHKGDNGRVLIFAGSIDHFGALWYAGTAASRYCDWVFVATDPKNVPIAKATSPAFTVVSFTDGLSLIKKADCVLAGPGLSKNSQTKKLLQKILQQKTKPMVLDATALRLLKPKDLHQNCIVTPHAGEFKSFFGQTPEPKALPSVAKRFGGVIVLKGPTDYIASPKKLFQNKTGNEGMTKGGTGDVLAGLIAAFATKNATLESALAATFLNGYAGDLLFKSNHTMYNAADLLNAIPFAYQKIRFQDPRQALK